MESAEEVRFLHSERSASKYHLFALKYIGMMLRLCMTDEKGKLVMSVDEKHLCMVQFLLLMHFVPDRKFTVCPDYIQEIKDPWQWCYQSSVQKALAELES